VKWEKIRNPKTTVNLQAICVGKNNDDPKKAFIGVSRTGTMEIDAVDVDVVHSTGTDKTEKFESEISPGN
jgi:hypothetical protein